MPTIIVAYFTQTPEEQTVYDNNNVNQVSMLEKTLTLQSETRHLQFTPGLLTTSFFSASTKASFCTKM